MSASQTCPLCKGSGFRSTDGGPAHQICECIDLEDEDCGFGFCEKCGLAHVDDFGCYRCRQIEEQAASPRSDEVDAGNNSASLTQNPTSPEQIAREIAKKHGFGESNTVLLEKDVHSSLLTVQKQEREQATRWRNDCGILLAQLDYLSEVTGETLDCQDAGLVEQIRTDYAAAIRQGDDNAG